VLSLYTPGTSVVHRAPAGLKLALLAVGSVVVMVIPSPVAAGVGLAVVVAGYVLARLPVGMVVRAMRWVLVLVAVIAGAQWLVTSAAVAALVALRILTLVLGATLVTYTTRTTDLIDAFGRFLPATVGLAIALALRFIPVLTDEAAHIREARAARGVRSRAGSLVPLVIRTVRMAGSVGEALEVRGAAP